MYLSQLWALTNGKGFRIPVPAPALGDSKDIIMNQRLQQCWGQDIVTIVAAGNSGPSEFLDENTPQRLGTPNNALITVGGVSNDGVFWPQTTIDRGQGGSITVYAGSVNVVMASYTSDDGTDTDTGTSFAAPAVVSGPYAAPYFC